MTAAQSVHNPYLTALLLSALLLFLSACPSEPTPVEPTTVQNPVTRADATDNLPAPMKRDEHFRRGASLGLFVSASEPKIRDRYYVQMLDEIKASGATDVSLVVRWQQTNIRTADIRPVPQVSVDDALVARISELAHARGLRVFLMPTLHIKKRGKKEWRGKIRPPQWDPWWVAYERFILHYADLCAAHNIELFAVGSELVSTEIQEARWRGLIKKVRARYNGKLTYSANWDHFEPIQFWDALDVVGLTAYQELSSAEAPTEDELLKGWLTFQQKIGGWAQRHGYKYMFTEIGYPTHSKAGQYPWDYTLKGAPDIDLQWRLYRVMFRAWQDDKSLAGLFIWNWFGPGGANDSGYSPRGKPSEQVLKHWYVGSRVGKK